MRWGLLLLCACKEFYGLDDTRLPPPDAPFACPKLGVGAPMFSSTVQQAVSDATASYHFDRSGALAVGDYEGFILVGRLDGELTKNTEIVPPAAYLYRDPHPSPDGNRLYVQSEPDFLVTSAIPQAPITLWERTNGAWTNLGEIDRLISSKGAASTVFAGRAGDRVIFVGTTNIEEYERVSGTQMMLKGAPHPRSELEIDRQVTMGVTTDGLRAIYRGAAGMMYTDRASIDEWFRAPVPLMGVPKVDDVQFTDDCSRIYFAGLGVAFYSRQQ